VGKIICACLFGQAFCIVLTHNLLKDKVNSGK